MASKPSSGGLVDDSTITAGHDIIVIPLLCAAAGVPLCEKKKHSLRHPWASLSVWHSDVCQHRGFHEVAALFGRSGSAAVQAVCAWQHIYSILHGYRTPMDTHYAFAFVETGCMVDEPP